MSDMGSVVVGEGLCVPQACIQAEPGTVAELLAGIRAAEDRLQVDMLHICFFGDGSGHVMAPARDWSDGGDRTDLECEEEVFEFRTPDQLMTWLREGLLPEQMPAAAEKEG